VPITAEISPAVKIPGAIGSRNGVLAAYSGSLCTGL
jgi:hypothetical protein